MSDKTMKRLRALGAVVLLLAIFTVAQSFYWRAKDKAIEDCFHQSFVELSQVMKYRGELVERESAVTKRIHLTYAEAAGAVKEDPTQELSPKAKEQLQRDLVDALLAYQQEIGDIEAEREANPVPPYPEGTCD